MTNDGVAMTLHDQPLIEWAIESTLQMNQALQLSNKIAEKYK